MASSLISFDPAKADALNSSLQKQGEKISTEFKSFQQKTDSDVRGWWKGGSEKVFLEPFAESSQKFQQALTQLMEDYKQLMQKVTASKQDFERQMGS